MAELRSQKWFDAREYYSFARRSQWRAAGITKEISDGKPVVGIANTFSELNPCNRHMRELAEAVKRGVWAAGGVPLEFPVISLGEMFLRPTAMLWRNLMSMDVEEMLTGNPIDAAVLLGGCDKTTPALLMGAASANVPSIVVTGGPMLNGQFRGTEIGSGTDGRKLFDLYRAGKLDEDDMEELACGMARSAGHCMVMGTASSMALVTEALGMSLPGGAAIPAADSRRLAMAEASGTRAVGMALNGGPKPREVLTREAFENAITVLMAAGASTNAVVHLLALAGRCGVPLNLDDFELISRRTPLLVDLKPHGRFLMEDFFAAGGGPRLMSSLRELLHRDEVGISGRSMAEELADLAEWPQEVIRDAATPLAAEGGIRVLYGNLAPNGALIKASAASAELMQHVGRAHVFESKEEMLDGVNREDLPVDERSVLVLRNAGPLGGPGFPEWGHIPMPKALMAKGVKDIVRISDARMSGTSFGTVVLHVSPEAAAGGVLGAVETGDEIELDVAGRRLELRVEPGEIARRLAARGPWKAAYERGYGKLFLEHVEQAHLGCDFGFLKL